MPMHEPVLIRPTLLNGFVSVKSTKIDLVPGAASERKTEFKEKKEARLPRKQMDKRNKWKKTESESKLECMETHPS